MKTILTTILALFFSLASSATGPCARQESYTKINVPIKNINSINNSTGNKQFLGNGVIPSSINFNNWKELTFEGTQTVESPLNIPKRLKVYTHGVITFKNISLEGSLYATGYTIVTILNFVPNNNPILYASDNTVTYIIEGKEYKLGDVVKGVKIQSCNNSLPAIFGKVKGIINKEELKVDFEILNEQNNKWFILSISEDGKHFTEIARVNSKGDSNNKINYSMVLPINRLSFASFGFAAFILIIFIFGTLVPNDKGKFTLIVLCVIGLIACSKTSENIEEQNPTKFKYFYIEQWDIDNSKTRSNIYKFN